jgi:hypothetical protein
VAESHFEITGELPERLAYLWGWFQELAIGRSYGPAGPNPISPQDIKAWADLMQIAPRPWEVKLLRYIDAAVMKRQTEAAARAEEERQARAEGLIPVRDVKGIQGMLARARARQNAKMEGS